MDNNKYTATEVFEGLKENVIFVDYDELRFNRNNLIPKAEKVMKTGQTRVAQNILFTLSAINKEFEALKQGYNTYVNKELLFEYIEKCDTRSVVINYLKDFPREVPDDITEKVNKLKELNIFDEFIVVFTDYTGEERSKVKEDEREKDPIIFGIFCDLNHKYIYDRFYFIGDWVDEYCDLTLDKLIIEQRDVNPHNTLVGHIDSSEFEYSDYSGRKTEEVVSRLQETVKEKTSINKEEKVTFLSKIKNFFNKN